MNKCRTYFEIGKQRKDGLRMVLLRLCKGRESKKRISTGVLVSRVDFNSGAKHGHWVKYSDSQAEVKNAILIRKYNEAENAFANLMIKGDNVSVENSVKILKGVTNDKSFFHFIEKLVQQQKESGHVTSYKKYDNSLKKLRAFRGKYDLQFADVKVELLAYYEAFLLKSGLSINSVNKELRIFRSWLYKAINQGLFDQGNNPFFRFKLKLEKTEKKKLTIDEIKKIEQLDLEIGSLIWHARNYFMFSFLMAGIRWGDLCRLKWENIDNDRLTYRMKKTSTPRSIKLFPQTQKILDYYRSPEKKEGDYIFPILNDETDYTDPFLLYNCISKNNALINKYLKVIAKKAEIKTNISFHIARHSFSEVCRLKNISIYDISKALGHSSIKITETYLQGFDVESVDAAMTKVFNY